eukprot:CAMPEP_0174256414 /NCGR_PEP_ID=MMETSP0439-20130205/5650_1 /TAXON_ID=0 /ORGANISM="Stereomyxa ramosa, Strain Chinc5" /LENGTH=1090 /DNA_ID=CAMNT_0015339007 /DNA_START=62 /DNA_END=3331 /DNA_ORIENTATION=-
MLEFLFGFAVGACVTALYFIWSAKNAQHSLYPTVKKELPTQKEKQTQAPQLTKSKPTTIREEKEATTTTEAEKNKIKKTEDKEKEAEKGKKGKEITEKEKGVEGEGQLSGKGKRKGQEEGEKDKKGKQITEKEKSVEREGQLSGKSQEDDGRKPLHSPSVVLRTDPSTNEIRISEVHIPESFKIKQDSEITIESLTVMTGWMEKLGEKGLRRSWKKRYFEQNGSNLYYYESENSGQALGCIKLVSILRVCPSKSDEVGFGLFTPGRVYHLRALSAEERPKWIAAIKRWHKYYKQQRRSESLQSIDEIEWDKLKITFQDPITGVQREDGRMGYNYAGYTTRKIQKTVRGAFSGKSAVDWVMDTFSGVDRAKALNVAVRLWATGLFYHISHSNQPISDDPNEFFVFKTRGPSRNVLPPSCDTLYGDKLDEWLEGRERWMLVKQPDGSWKRCWCAIMKLHPSHPWLDPKQRLICPDGENCSSLEPSHFMLFQHTPGGGGGIDTKKKTEDKPENQVVKRAEKRNFRNYSLPVIMSKDAKRRINDLQYQIKRNSSEWQPHNSNLDPIEQQNSKKNSGEEAWFLVIFEEIPDKYLIDLIKQMTDKQTGLSIKTRRFVMKNYPNCFVGNKCTRWLVANRNQECPTRAAACGFMNNLIHKGLVCNVTQQKYYFEDAKQWYAFLECYKFNENAQPIGCIELRRETIFKLEKANENYVHIILTKLDNRAVVLPNAHSESAAPSSASFEMQLPSKDSDTLKAWIFTLEATIHLQGAQGDQEKLELDGYESDGTSGTDEDIDEEHELVSVSTSKPIESPSLEPQKIEDFTQPEPEEEDVEEAEDKQMVPSMEPQKGSQITSILMTKVEKEALEEVKSVLQEEKENGVTHPSGIDFTQVDDVTLLKYVRARKLELEPSINLLKAGLWYRDKNNLNDISISEVLPEIQGGMFRVLPDARDKDGRLVLVVMTEHYRPAKSSPQALIRAVYYLLDNVLEGNAKLQRIGFSVVIDCKNSSYSNFDSSMPKPLIEAVVGKYPARVGYVIIVNIPWFFRFVWAIIRSLLSDYLAQKFHIATIEEITQWVEASSLLPMHGGSYQYDHIAW